MAIKDIPDEIIQWGAGVLAATVAVIGRLFHSRLSRVEQKLDSISEQLIKHESHRNNDNPTNEKMNNALKPIKEDIKSLHQKTDNLYEFLIKHLIDNGNHDRK